MKLHLPSGLRAAIMACFTIVPGIAVPAVSASLVGGVVVATLVAAAPPVQAEAVVWDANWGIADAPTTIPDDNVIQNIPSGFTFLSAAGSPYTSGGETIVRLEGTATGATQVAVIGGAGATTNSTTESEGPITVNTWMKVTGGSYVTLAGGSYAQNYVGGAVASFTGDSHILLAEEGGTSPSVDYVVGGNYLDAQSAAFTGNSYISVTGGSVNGSIVGGGTSAHIRTAVFNGNSNVWIYTPLSSSAAPRFELPGNVIVGGNAAINNYAPRLEQTGNSLVMVDVSAYTPGGGASTPEMEKIIVGDAWLLPNTISSHTGNAVVGITGTMAQGGSSVTFSQPVVAGSWFSGSGTATLSGNAGLTINGGTFTNALVGGAYMASSTASGVSSTISGSTTLTLGGALEMSGSGALVAGGSYVNAAAAVWRSGTIDITINGGRYAGNIIGGSYIAEGSGTTTQTTGDITLTISGGTISGTIYGGSYSLRNNSASTNTHGSITISLAGGSVLGNVYAGGGVAMVGQEPAAALSGVTATSTQVQVADSVVLGAASAPITISGGMQNSNATSGVEGDRTLLLDSTNGYTNLNNAIFYNFNVVENVSAATLRLQEVDRDFTKKGAGVLSISGAGSNLNPISSLVVEQGVLNTGSAWLTQAYQGLSSISIGAGASLVTDGLVLANGASLALDVTGATSPLITVGVAGGLSVTGQKQLNLTLTGVDSLAGGSQITLMSWGNTEAASPLDLSQLTWTNKGSGMEAYELNIVNKTLVLSRAESLEWVGGSDTWSATGSEWDGQSGVDSDGKAVSFATPAESEVVVSISGEVAPQSIVVDNGAGTLYTFQVQEGGTGSISGTTSLSKENEGTLKIALENAYSGGTLVNGGTVEAAAQNALGTGAVTLNTGGTLLASVEGALAQNELMFNGGSLSYAANETRDLNTAGITHAEGVVPEVSVAAGNSVSWQYSGAEGATALQDALGGGCTLNGGGTLNIESMDAAVSIALSGSLNLEGEGTTLALGSLGAKQLGAVDAPMAIALGKGTTLRVESPQADAPSVITSALSGTGALEFVNTNAGADNTLRLVGDNSAFAGSINLGAAATQPNANAFTDTPAVLLDYSQGSPVGGADATLNLNGLAFATLLENGQTTTTESAVNVNVDTTQYAQTPGLVNTFSGDVTGAAGSTWTLDATPVEGGQSNVLAGELSGFAGTLSAEGREGSPARWQLGGEGAVAQSNLSLNLTATNAFNEFVVDYAAETALSGAVSGQANLTQQGAGTLVLTGNNDSSGTLTIAEGCEVQLGRAEDAGSWGNANGSELSGSGTLTLVHGTLNGPLALAADSAPMVNARVAAGCSVDMGGNSGSLISGSITLAEGATLTNVGSSILDKVLNLTLSTANIGSGAAATAMVQFVDDGTMNVLRASRAVTASLGGTTAAIELDASAAGVVELLRQHRVAGAESYLTLTNGTLVTAADYSNVSFGSNMDILTDLGLRMVRVEGGSLVLSGEAQGVYIAGAGEDPTEVAGYQNLGAYQAVAVMPGETLTLSLDGAPDATLDGEGATLNNLLGAEDSALVVNNTNTAGEEAVVILNNSLQPIDPVPGGLPGDPVGADTTFGGSIAQQGGDVEFVKMGAGTLTIGGPVTAHQLTAREGTLALNGDGNALDALAFEGGSVELGRGSTTIREFVDSANGGRLSLADGAMLEAAGGGRLVNTQIGGSGTLRVTGELALAEASSLNDVALSLAGGTLTLDGTSRNTTPSLSGYGRVNGIGTPETVGLSVTGQGGNYSGALAGNGTLTVASGASQTFSNGFAGGSGWNLVNNGNMLLDFVQADGSNAPMALNALTLGAGSVTGLNMNLDASTGNALTLGAISVAPGARMNLTASRTSNIVRSDSSIIIGSVADGQLAGTLGTITPDRSNIVFMLVDASLSTLSVDAEGNLLLNLVTSRTNNLAPLASNSNSAAGAELLWNAAFEGDTAVGTDIRNLLEALNSGVSAGEADRILAAASGSSTAVLSSAFASDVERQLRAVRNRTTLMTSKPCTVCKGALPADAPHFYAWVNGEGDHRKMKAEGFMPGYTLTSWGGTVGVDMSCSDKLIGGMALTAMYGDLKAHSADHAEGDFNRYYISAFARMKSHRWQHTLLGTIGRLDADFDRTVYYGTGSYRTHGDTDGWGYGLMYEIGYSIPMDDDASVTLQPVANVSWRYVDIDGYTERGSDAALRVNGQDYNVITFGAGLRAQAQVGERFFNRRALLEGRALVKVDTGDREGEAMVAMLGGGGLREKVRSAKLEAVGVELGAGISFPLSNDKGAFFIDGSAELRNSYSNLNGSVGYRFEF